jgi:rubredoxin
MKCVFCGYEFSEKEGVGACKGCPMAKCDMIKCPNCGYETLPEPKLVKFFKRWLKSYGN